MLLDKKMPFLYIFAKIRTELVYVLIIGAIVFSITNKLIHLIPEIPLAVPSFLGTAMSVILSFKLSQSYDRWWEARKIWGSIVNDSRNLVLQLQGLASPGNQKEIRKITLRQIAWCHCLGQSLRNLDASAGLDGFLEKGDLAGMEEHSNKPLALLQMNNEGIASLRRAGEIDAFSHVQINNTLVNLVNAMGMAERIKNTVFPVTYRIFLHLAIYVVIILLCISLRGLGYFELPLLLIIASFFFLLERTATLLQDPFSNKPTDTPMTAIATTIEINLKQLIGDPNVPQPHQRDNFYLN